MLSIKSSGLYKEEDSFKPKHILKKMVNTWSELTVELGLIITLREDELMSLLHFSHLKVKSSRRLRYYVVILFSM